MFASSARVRPCSALLCFSSSGRLTTRFPSAWVTLISGCTLSSSLPLGPSTLTCWSLIATFAFPTGTGFLPIRLMFVLLSGLALGLRRLPAFVTQLADGAEQLATDVLLARPAVGHHALARADHGDTHAV